MRKIVQLSIVAVLTAVTMYGCGDQGNSPSSPQFNRSAVTAPQIDCGDVGYLSQLSPVLPAWKDSLESWLGDSDLLDETPQWSEMSTPAGYLGDLVPVLQQWEPAINDALASALLDTVADFDPSGSAGDYIAGLSSLLVAWKDSLETERGTAFLAPLPVYQPDGTAPLIVCAADTSIGCAGEDGVVVEFEVTASDECDPAPVVTCEPASGSVFPLGDTEVTCTATDFSGNTSTCAFTVTVSSDEMPPDVRGVTASPDILWPPNHKWVDVQLIADAANDCGGELTCEVLDVTSNEPINGPGDGDTDPDWMITDDGALKLRAERSGNLTGRIYRIHGQCVDGSGNTTEFDAEVTVPHDQGKSGK